MRLAIAGQARHAMPHGGRAEARYAELALDDDSWNQGTLIAAMADHPILIERPIVFRGDRAIVGRPPERVITLLDD